MCIFAMKEVSVSSLERGQSRAVPEFSVCMLGNKQLEVAHVIALHKISHNTRNIVAHSKCFLVFSSSQKCITRRLCRLVNPTMHCVLLPLFSF